jgi:O-antigen ligase
MGDLLRTDSPVGNAIDAPLGTVSDVRRAYLPVPGRGAQATAAAATVVVVAFGVAGGPAAAGLSLLAVVALVTGARAPGLLGPLVALLLPAGETVRVLGAQVAPLEAVLGGGAIGYLVHIAMRQERVRRHAAHWMFLGFLVFVALSTLGPVDNSDRLRELAFWGALGVVFLAITSHLRIRRNFTLLFVSLAASTLVEASIALYQYLDSWSGRFSLLHGAIVYPLPDGTLEHSNALGHFLVLGALTVLALALAERGVLRHAGFVVAGLGAVGLLVTFSRASWIAFVIGGCVYVLSRATRRVALAAGGAGVIVGSILVLASGSAIGARISSLFRGDSGGLYDFRLELIRRGARSVADHPLTGTGHFEVVGVYAGRPDVATHPHNVFLGLAVFFGIPAALAFAGLVLLAMRAAWRASRVPGDARCLTALGLVGVFIAFLANGLFEYPFWSKSLTVVIALVLALGVALDPGGAAKPGVLSPARHRRSRIT